MTYDYPTDEEMREYRRIRDMPYRPSLGPVIQPTLLSRAAPVAYAILRVLFWAVAFVAVAFVLCASFPDFAILIALNAVVFWLLLLPKLGGAR